MFKIKVFSVGKTKEEWLEEALKEYLKRLSPVAQIEFIFAKNDEQLLSLTSKEENLICLDPKGKLLDSLEFSKELFEALQKGGSRIGFVIGGPEGLPKILRNRELISFSPMTFTHQLSRLILVEQIYRAFEIEKGSKYHK